MRVFLTEDVWDKVSSVDRFVLIFWIFFFFGKSVCVWMRMVSCFFVHVGKFHGFSPSSESMCCPCVSYSSSIKIMNMMRE